MQSTVICPRYARPLQQIILMAHLGGGIPVVVVVVDSPTRGLNVQKTKAGPAWREFKKFGEQLFEINYGHR